MSIQHFPPEFKDEAVRQIIERSYSVAHVSARLGVSAHSLYKWVKAIKPDKTEQHATELIVAKSEILRLRAQLHRTKEERDTLKKAAFFAMSRSIQRRATSAPKRASSIYSDVTAAMGLSPAPLKVSRLS